MLLKIFLLSFGLVLQSQTIAAQALECESTSLVDFTATITTSFGSSSSTRYNRAPILRIIESARFDLDFDADLYVKDDAGLLVEAKTYFATNAFSGRDFFNFHHYSENNQEWNLREEDLFADVASLQNDLFSFRFHSSAASNGKIPPPTDGFMVIELKDRVFFDKANQEVLPVPLASVFGGGLNAASLAEESRVMDYYTECSNWVTQYGGSSDPVEYDCPSATVLTIDDSWPNNDVADDNAVPILRPPSTRIFGKAVNYTSGEDVMIEYTMYSHGVFDLDTEDVPFTADDGETYLLRSADDFATQIAYAQQGFSIDWIGTDEEGNPVEPYQEKSYGFRYPDLLSGETATCDITCDSTTLPHPVSPLSSQLIREPIPFATFRQVVPDVLNAQPYEKLDFTSNNREIRAPVLRPNFASYLSRPDAFSSIRDYVGIVTEDAFMVRNASEILSGCGEMDYVPSDQDMCTTGTDECLARLGTNAHTKTGEFFQHPEYAVRVADVANQVTMRSIAYNFDRTGLTTLHVPDVMDVNSYTEVATSYPADSFTLVEPYLYYTALTWETENNTALVDEACSQVVWEPSLVPYEEETGKLILLNVSNRGLGDALVTATVTCTGDNIVTPAVPVEYTVPELEPRDLEINLRVTGIENSTTSTCSVTLTITQKPLWSATGKTVVCEDLATIETYFGLFTHPCDLQRPTPVLNIAPTKTSYIILGETPTKVLEVDVSNNGTEALIRTSSNSTRCVYDEEGTPVTESDFVANASSTVTQNTHILTGDDQSCGIKYEWQKHRFCDRFEEVASLSLLLANDEIANEDSEVGIGMAAGISAAVGLSIVFAALAVYLMYKKTRGGMGARGSYLSLSGFTHKSMLAPEELVLMSADGQYRKLTQFTATRHSELCLLHANDQEVIVFGTIVSKTGDSKEIVIDDIREIFLDRENDDVWIETERCMYFLDKPQAEYNIFFSSLKSDLKVLMDAQAAGI